MNVLAQQDPAIWKTIEDEARRQQEGLEMIASENYTSAAVMAAQGSVLTNKYAEGLPGKRYYGGCEFVDVAEKLAIEQLVQRRATALAGERASREKEVGPRLDAVRRKIFKFSRKWSPRRPPTTIRMCWVRWPKPGRNSPTWVPTFLTSAITSRAWLPFSGKGLTRRVPGSTCAGDKLESSRNSLTPLPIPRPSRRARWRSLLAALMATSGHSPMMPTLRSSSGRAMNKHSGTTLRHGTLW